jgi:S1-C subfamily serine protease
MRRAATFIRWSLPIMLLATAAPTGLTAQEPEDEDQECICVNELTGMRVIRPMLHSNRARIGVLLGEPAQVDGRTGVTVEDVTPDGPADRAGLQPDDIILGIGDRDLGDTPARDILDAMGDVEPGDTVTVRYARGDQERTARVVAEEARDVSVFVGSSRPGREAFQFRTPGVAVAPTLVGEAPGGWWAFPGSDLELVELNPRLGEYFGADQGVLVVDVDDDSSLGLEPGDVILAIDGRDVRDAGHARSILRSYAPDESVTFRIVRDQRQTEVTGTREP